jgi:hypothetical protein
VPCSADLVTAADPAGLSVCVLSWLPEVSTNIFHLFQSFGMESATDVPWQLQ